MSIEVNNESGADVDETEIVALARHVFERMRIHHQAELIKLNLKSAGHKLDPSGGLPTTIVLRADKDATSAAVLDLIKACQSNGFRKFALKAMNNG